MKPMTNLLDWIFEPMPMTMAPPSSHERYLAGAEDIYDLERRMRELDDPRRHHAPIGPFGWNV